MNPEVDQNLTYFFNINKESQSFDCGLIDAKCHIKR